MRLTVDRERCGGHGRCIALAPELFDLDDDEGLAFPLHEDIDDDQIASAREAATNCPQSAIGIE